MTTMQLVVSLLFLICFIVAYHLSSRRPWDGKLGTWKLDPSVRRAKRRHAYWPEPDHPMYDWKRPGKRPSLPGNFSYCLRCGKFPFLGPQIMYSPTKGFMCLCYSCANPTVTTEAEIQQYAHRMIDILICQNLDPYFIHPDQAMPIVHFYQMWQGALAYLKVNEETRGS